MTNPAAHTDECYSRHHPSILTLAVHQVNIEAADCLHGDARVSVGEQNSLQLQGQVLEGLLNKV